MRNALPAWKLVGPAAVKLLSEPVPTWRRIGATYFFDQSAEGLPFILSVKQLGLNDLLQSQTGQVASQDSQDNQAE